MINHSNASRCYHFCVAARANLINSNPCPTDYDTDVNSFYTVERNQTTEMPQKYKNYTLVLIMARYHKHPATEVKGQTDFRLFPLEDSMFININ